MTCNSVHIKSEIYSFSILTLVRYESEDQFRKQQNCADDERIKYKPTVLNGAKANRKGTSRSKSNHIRGHLNAGYDKNYVRCYWENSTPYDYNLIQ
jgi:hypothetical protein